MKREIAVRVSRALIGVIILGVAGMARADFVIRLRDGKEVVVDKYREDGDQIRYKRFGGEIGIPKSLVAVIEDQKTGEKRVYNPLLSDQEKSERREEQAEQLREIERRQEIRDRALVEPAPRAESPRATEERDVVVTPTPDPAGPVFDFGKCMATGTGTMYEHSDWAWGRMPHRDKVGECESAERSAKWRAEWERDRPLREKARREKARREQEAYEEVLRERERVRLEQLLRERK